MTLIIGKISMFCEKLLHIDLPNIANIGFHFFFMLTLVYCRDTVKEFNRYKIDFELRPKESQMFNRLMIFFFGIRCFPF